MKKTISGKYTWKRRSATNFDLWGMSFKKYYSKTIEDRDPIFVALFFYCNILNEKNNSEHENIRKYGLAGRVNFTPPWYIVWLQTPLVQQGLTNKKGMIKWTIKQKIFTKYRVLVAL